MNGALPLSVHALSLKHGDNFAFTMTYESIYAKFKSYLALCY